MFDLEETVATLRLDGLSAARCADELKLQRIDIDAAFDRLDRLGVEFPEPNLSQDEIDRELIAAAQRVAALLLDLTPDRLQRRASLDNNDIERLVARRWLAWRSDGETLEITAAGWEIGDGHFMGLLVR